VAGVHITAVCLETDAPDGPKVGFAVPRALGGAVVRNRMKRRLREAIRPRLARLPARWLIVLQPRRSALEAAFQDLERDVEQLIRRCGG
jgi:ribonuclease P protein component